ncbi:MAG: 16S rRNA (guanine(527)-N(7))-methyltransferase RsmG [Actinomycetota bacterium]
MSDLRAHSGLLRVFTEAQRVGALGPVAPADVITHSLAFVEVIPAAARTVADLGTGAGVPGLVIAVARPDLEVLLVDRRAKRIDALQRAIISLGLGARVRALCGDAESYGHGIHHRSVDVVTCRGFGSPETTIRLSTPWVVDGGIVAISEPPEDRGDRWAAIDLAAAHTGPPTRVGPLAVFHVKHQAS